MTSFFEKLLSEDNSASTTEMTPDEFPDTNPMFNEVNYDNLAELSKTKAGSKQTQQIIARATPEDIGRIVHILASPTNNSPPPGFGS
mmetsp:Transcript_32418/g.5865  ORF Transcript_32418/g.5865 Transcript_32418/m.5865 type:complete len:87 (+) Transcript_32418:94-354(+)|eukprot:CAMPEP_0168315946 /NCGR_PEP_ID=MMETSP0210-20121227/13412_1 /TAXON_ID=40633 /ORGANISM="Condylostoma magnum, Strain COL2" /LENGTH=86 /DNA_ID=CAMNT_0008292937 /DNA_START=68 /DNA_END=328 /DNA_ORIENTATION=-